MKRHSLAAVVSVTVLVALLTGPVGSGQSAPNLTDAIKARTEAVALRQEVAATVLDQMLGADRASKAAQAMRKVVAKAESKQEEGNILLTKDRYGEAVESYTEAAKLYRKALDWRKVQKALAKAEQGAAAARLLAETAAAPGKLAPAKNLQINAEGYLEAGEIDLAIAEFDKARAAFTALIPQAGPASLEDAIAARTAMQAARDQIKDRPRFAGRGRDDDEGKGPKAGSLTDLVTRAGKAEAAAADALDERQYAPARGLFAAAEKLYRDAAVVQGKRDAVLASRKSVEDSLNLANQAFKGEARPASFERGKQAVADADKALGDDDLETAKPLLAQAAEQFAAARAEADKINALGNAQQAWAAALAAADEEILTKHVASQFAAAKAKAADAQAKGSTALFADATGALKDAVAAAKTKENAAKAGPVIARLETAVAGRDKFGAEDVLAELEALIPTDARLAALREKVAALPGPKKKLSVDLGGGVAMELVLIRPGAFTMGENEAAHKVTISKPFYIGRFEVTQEQWEKVMGSNPSNFKGAKNPVENVSWNDSQSFVAKLNEKVPGTTFALPTEAQWEYACRAGNTTDPANLDEVAWHAGNSGSKTHPVGEKKANAWGVHDMLGNVWEWCADWYGDYPKGDVTDPVGPSSGSRRVLRGGSWLNTASYCRSAHRGRTYPSNCNYYCGVRVVVVVR
jgi:formylglycine-generating enzyme required for sulfatase activity